MRGFALTCPALAPPHLTHACNCHYRALRAKRGGSDPTPASSRLKLLSPRRAPASELLTGLSEATGPRFVISQLWRHVAAHKNPKVTEGALLWVADAVAEFTVGSLDVKQLIEMSKECLASTNPGVKGSAIKLLGVLHTFMGPGVKNFLGAWLAHPGCEKMRRCASLSLEFVPDAEAFLLSFPSLLPQAM